MINNLLSGSVADVESRLDSINNKISRCKKNIHSMRKAKWPSLIKVFLLTFILPFIPSRRSGNMGVEIFGGYWNSVIILNIIFYIEPNISY